MPRSRKFTTHWMWRIWCWGILVWGFYTSTIPQAKVDSSPSQLEPGAASRQTSPSLSSSPHSPLWHHFIFIFFFSWVQSCKILPKSSYKKSGETTYGTAWQMLYLPPDSLSRLQNLGGRPCLEICQLRPLLSRRPGSPYSPCLEQAGKRKKEVEGSPWFNAKGASLTRLPQGSFLT